MESDFSPAPERRTESADTAAGIRAEIESRLSFFPPYFAPAEEFPVLLQSLWRQQCEGYHDNPLPATFKESLLACLARYCASPYFLIIRACRLYDLGMPPEDILQLIETPDPSAGDIERTLALLTSRSTAKWPERDSKFDEGLIVLCVAIFLGLKDSERCVAELRNILGRSYGSLALLLSYANAAHFWVETHPEIGCESHPVVRRSFFQLVRREPRLVEIFQRHRERGRQTGIDTERANVTGGATDDAVGIADWREVCENASCIIYTHDFAGRLLSVNPAMERITGYSRTDALRMKITDIIVSEHAHFGLEMTNPRVSGERPFTCEVDVLARDGSRVTLGINTQPIFCDGKPVAVQGIAQDITRFKRTEIALREANRKLEAWVGESEQHRRETALLHEMEDILHVCSTMEEARKVIFRFVRQVFPAQPGALYMLTLLRDIAEPVLVWDNPDLTGRAFFHTECWALRRGRTHCVENDQAGMICKHIHHPVPDGYLCVPLMAQSEAIGVLHLTPPNGVRMTKDRQRLAATMAEHIALTLSTLRLQETLRAQAIRDPLTGLFNRRFMEESLELEIHRA
ncbi:MAG: PAS domain S-box protein, partial [Acidobacteriota bacterium]|nr:PAS domain S-box protein [Acidobacteriota bacterium]